MLALEICFLAIFFDKEVPAKTVLCGELGVGGNFGGRMVDPDEARSHMAAVVEEGFETLVVDCHHKRLYEVAAQQQQHGIKVVALNTAFDVAKLLTGQA
jgi:predicted ATP-dependent serine protease